MPKTLSLAEELLRIKAIDFGSFTLKTGIISPIYVDLRKVISYPLIFKKIIEQAIGCTKALTFDTLCGVPYGAVPLATGLALACQKPLILARKEVKEHGTGNQISGVYKKNDRILIIEDVVTSGSSIVETVTTLRSHQLQITDALIVVDREQGGRRILDENGIRLHSLYTLSALCGELETKGFINAIVQKQVFDYLKRYQF